MPQPTLTWQQEKAAPGEFSDEIGDQLCSNWFQENLSDRETTPLMPTPVNEDKGVMVATVHRREVKEKVNLIFHIESREE